MFNTHRVHTLIALLAVTLFSSLSVEPVMAQPTSVQGAIAAGSTSAQNPVVIGGVDADNKVRSTRVSASGVLSFGLNAAGQDSFTNSQVMYLKDIDDNSGIVPIAPMIFNPISGNWDRQRFCEKTAIATPGAIGNSQFLTGTSGKSIYICSVMATGFSGNGLVSVFSGSGSVCATSTKEMSGYIGVLNGDSKFVGGNTGYLAVSDASANLCIASLTANSISVTVKYTVY